MVCSSSCAEQSRKNYQEKKDKNIKPGQPMFNTIEVEDTSDDSNIDL